MKVLITRTIWAAAFAAVAMTASAETYVAKIYGVPAGYDYMYGVAAGGNGMISGYAKSTSTGEEQALYLTPTGIRDMHPAGWTSSHITDAWGSTYHVGFGAPSGTVPLNALLWIGGGAPINLHPSSGADSTMAFGGDGQLQVGSGTALDLSTFTLVTKGCTWSRTAASFRYLLSPSHTNVTAYGTDGTAAVGEGTITAQKHALYWPTIGQVPRDLNPSGATESQSLTTHSGQQGGYFISPATSGNQHAALWTGSSGTMVDLNPNAAFTSSSVVRVRGGLQVGTGTPITSPLRKQAIAWHGASGTWINLHFMLPYPFTFWSSAAGDIDANGNITGTIESPDGTIRRPVIWERQ
jgi:hypothetical protein